MIHPTLNHINTYADAIIDSIPEEAVAVYSRLIQEFKGGDVTQNKVFQFLYRSYYRLDNAGLSDAFKEAYFQLMQEIRGEKSHDIDGIVRELSRYPRLKEQKSAGDQAKGSLQFSFATKLLNTIDHEYPIYDSEVARVFGFSPPDSADFDRKLQIYRDRYKKIHKTYCLALASGELQGVIDAFQHKYAQYDVPSKRILDFVYWTAGKVMAK